MHFFQNPVVKFIFRFLIIAVVIIVVIHLINIILYSRNVEYVDVPIKSKKIAPELDGYKIAFITDTHQIPKENLEAVVNHLNDEIQPDLVTLGGDFPNRLASKRTMEILSKIDNNDGIFSIEGNHDIRHELVQYTAENDITLLLNEGARIKDGLFLAGSEDLWVGTPNIPLATTKAKSDDFVFLLSHNPDVSMWQPMDNIDFVASGHTHGGHVTFFGIWAPALANTKEITDFGQKFMSGMCEGNDGVPVYVSNGTGYYNVFIPRVYARPQVIIFELKAED